MSPLNSSKTTCVCVCMYILKILISNNGRPLFSEEYSIISFYRHFFGSKRELRRGVNFINVLRAAFMCSDPESAKKCTT